MPDVSFKMSVNINNLKIVSVPKLVGNIYEANGYRWPKFVGPGLTKDWSYLYPPFRRKVEMLAEICVRQNIKVKWSETGRTVVQQKKYKDSGASRTMRSRHIIGCAIDFDPSPGTERNYLRVRDLAKSIGLHVLGKWDLRHIELKRGQLPKVGWNS